MKIPRGYFILFLNGPRGSFKTQIALVMTQIERLDSPEYTLKAKQAALETGFKRYKDAVMLVDDLAPTQELSDRKFMQSNLELITRSFGDGTGKKRNYDFQKENFNVEQYEAEGGAIITGEYTTGCESSLSRAVFLPLKREDVDISLLTQIQEDKGRLAAFMVGFIPFLGCYGEEIIVFIREEGKRYRNQLLHNYSNPRYAEYYAQLMVAAELLLYYGVYVKQIEEAERSSILAFWNEYIKAAIHYNDTLLRRESPTVQLCNAIIAGIEMEVFPIIRYGETVSKELKKLIMESETSFFITQADALELKEWYVNKNEIKTDKYSTTELARMLYEAGVISKVTEGETVRYARKISGYGNRRFMELRKEKLYKIAKGDYV